MTEAFNVVQWLTVQSGNALLVVALTVVGWMFYKANSRLVTNCESEKAALLAELSRARENYHARTDISTAKLFDQANAISEMTGRCVEVLERVERKLK